MEGKGEREEKELQVNFLFAIFSFVETNLKERAKGEEAKQKKSRVKYLPF